MSKNCIKFANIVGNNALRIPYRVIVFLKISLIDLEFVRKHDLNINECKFIYIAWKGDSIVFTSDTHYYYSEDEIKDIERRKQKAFLLIEKFKIGVAPRFPIYALNIVKDNLKAPLTIEEKNFKEIKYLLIKPYQERTPKCIAKNNKQYTKITKKINVHTQKAIHIELAQGFSIWIPKSIISIPKNKIVLPESDECIIQEFIQKFFAPNWFLNKEIGEHKKNGLNLNF